MVWSDVIYGVFFEPRATLRSLSEEKPLAPAIATFIMVAVFNLIIYRGIILQNDYSLDGMHNFLWLWQVFGALFSFFMLFVMAGLFSLLSELFYKKNNASGLLVCLGFASLPGVLGPPLYYGTVLMDIQWLGVICSILVGIWTLVLQVLSLREALEISTGRAVLLFLLPGLLIFIGVVAIIMMIALGGMAIK